MWFVKRSSQYLGLNSVGVGGGCGMSGEQLIGKYVKSSGSDHPNICLERMRTATRNLSYGSLYLGWDPKLKPA
jgi:hypothetical protein